jgi:hypothetical protein
MGCAVDIALALVEQVFSGCWAKARSSFSSSAV